METVGSLADKLSINELKIWHVREQNARDDVDETFKADCQRRLAILNEQKRDLKGELDELLSNLAAKKTTLKLYRQLKMYNEKKFQD